MNKKGFLERTIEIILWIIVFIVLLMGVYYLIKFLTKI